MTFSRVVQAGIDRIYSDPEDLRIQQERLERIMSKVRSMDSVKPLLDAKAFYVPNNDYMLETFGIDCADPFLDIYDFSNNCVWHGHVVFPIWNIAGSPVGFAGFDPEEKYRRDTQGGPKLTNYYRYSRKSVFNRGDYIYMLPGVYEKAIKDGYLVLTDGIFDMLSFYRFGFNSGSLLGSSSSPVIMFLLRFIKNVFLAHDNDEAGLKLFNDMKRMLPRLKSITQNVKKDADATLNSEYSERYQKEVWEGIHNKADVVVRFKPLIVK